MASETRLKKNPTTQGQFSGKIDVERRIRKSRYLNLCNFHMKISNVYTVFNVILIPDELVFS